MTVDLDAITRWYVASHPDAGDVQIDVEAPPGATGYSNELLFVRVSGDTKDAIVLRLAPAGEGIFPTDDLGMQITVQEAAGRAGVPVVSPISLETDEAYLGRPFMVMPMLTGRHPGEAPVFTKWILALSPDEQRALHVGVLDAMAALHRAPVNPAVAACVRGDGRTLKDECDWWDGFIDWACPDVDATALRDLFAWCRNNLPSNEPPLSMLWGDVRLGNVVVATDSVAPLAILDWEMATIGPAESDVAWLTALSDMTDNMVGDRVPGFLTRAEIIEHYEAALGRPLLDLEWHEMFAMSRAAAIHLRTEIAKAHANGTPLPDPARHGVVRYVRKLLD